MKESYAFLRTSRRYDNSGETIWVQPRIIRSVTLPWRSDVRFNSDAANRPTPYRVAFGGVNNIEQAFTSREELHLAGVAIPFEPDTPPCARYEGGEGDDRLIKVWAYVAILVGGGSRADELGRKVARLYDYKGLLVVATRGSLSAHVEALFRDAWATVGREFEEQVEFCDVQSDRWELLWGLRRFESDWRP